MKLGVPSLPAAAIQRGAVSLEGSTNPMSLRKNPSDRLSSMMIHDDPTQR